MEKESVEEGMTVKNLLEIWIFILCILEQPRENID